MLAADKKLLERQLEVELLVLRQKELDHLSECLFTLAGPSALLAGFAYIGTTGQVPIPEGTHWALEGLYFALIAGAMLAEIAVTVRTTLVALKGRALALRGSGPDAMHRAVQMMEVSFKGAWQVFLAGLRLLLLAALVFLGVQSEHWGVAVFFAVVILAAIYELFRDIRFVARQFELPAQALEVGRFSPAEVEALRQRRAAEQDELARELARSRREARSLGGAKPGVAASTCSSADGGSFSQRVRAARKCAKSAALGAGGPEQGYLPCVTGRLSTRLSGGRSPLDAPGARVRPARSEPAPDAAPELSVILSVHGRGRLRWRIAADATVADALREGEAHFGTALSSVADAHDVVFATPDTERLDGLAVLSSDEHVVVLSARPVGGRVAR